MRREASASLSFHSLTRYSFFSFRVFCVFCGFRPGANEHRNPYLFFLCSCSCFVRLSWWFQVFSAGRLKPRTHTKSYEKSKNTKVSTSLALVFRRLTAKVTSMIHKAESLSPTKMRMPTDQGPRSASFLPKSKSSSPCTRARPCLCFPRRSRERA